MATIWGTCLAVGGGQVAHRAPWLWEHQGLLSQGGAGITPTCLPAWLQNSGTVMEKRREVTLSAAKAECTFPELLETLDIGGSEMGVLYMETLTSI